MSASNVAKELEIEVVFEDESTYVVVEPGGSVIANIHNRTTRTVTVTSIQTGCSCLKPVANFPIQIDAGARVPIALRPKDDGRIKSSPLRLVMVLDDGRVIASPVTELRDGSLPIIDPRVVVWTSEDTGLAKTVNIKMPPAMLLDSMEIVGDGFAIVSHECEGNSHNIKIACKADYVTNAIFAFNIHGAKDTAVSASKRYIVILKNSGT